MGEKVLYTGRDLEAMSFAVNYHRWILRLFSPYLGERLVEVGAGTGSFSELLLERDPEALYLVEPSETMYRILEEQIGHPADRGTVVRTYSATFPEVADELAQGRPDSAIYVNVLEHILDDEVELDAVYRTLDRGGRLFVFVPALRWLYGSFDAKIDHHRRYTKGELEGKCRRAGFEIVESRYFDVAGILPWWVKYRLLRSDSMEAGAVKLYDSYVVPVASRLEASVRPPIGKNVLLVASKP